MFSPQLLSGVFAVLVLTSANAAATAVHVTFVNPEKYHEEDFRWSSQRAGITAEFQKYFQTLGARYLQKGQTVTIDVLDVDLAGRYEPWRPDFSHVRIMRDTTPPSFKLRYTMTQGRVVLVRGEETVTDMNYLWNSFARNSSERFAYEKDMLRDWFRRRFVQRQPPRPWIRWGHTDFEKKPRGR